MHEVSRVFGDRLNSEADRLWFHNLLFELLETFWKMRTLREDFDRSKLIFGDLLRLEAGRDYEQISDYKRLLKILDDKLDEYNSEHQSKMHLVFFSDAIDHITRIARVLRLARGNMLLIGMGGSGKQSLTKFSTFTSNYKLMMIEIVKGYGMEDFRKFLRERMKAINLEESHTVFMFTDNQIVVESFLDDINNILNSGEVPNLWPSEEYDLIIQDTRPFNKKLARA